MRFFGISSKMALRIFLIFGQNVEFNSVFQPREIVKNFFKLFQVKDALRLMIEWHSSSHFISYSKTNEFLIQKLSSHGFETNYSVFQAFWPNLACVSPKYYHWIISSYTVISCSKWWDWNVTFRKWYFHDS